MTPSIKTTEPAQTTQTTGPAVPSPPGVRDTAASAVRAGRVRAGRAAAWTAFGWVMVFLAWHVVWAVTGLKFPSSSDHHGSGKVVQELFTVVVYVMVAVGTALPVALACRWGRRLPRWLLLTTAWAGCGLLGARGFAGVADDVVRVTGILPNGLTGLTMAQVTGSAHPSTWAVVASGTTDVLFAAGALAFGAAALTYGRASS